LANPGVAFDALRSSSRNASGAEGRARLKEQQPCGQVLVEDRGCIPGKRTASTPDKAELALPRIPPRVPDQTNQFLSEKSPNDQCRGDQSGRKQE